MWDNLHMHFSILFGLKAGEVEVMYYDLFRFGSIRDELYFIVVESIFLGIVLLCEYKRKRLEEKYKELKKLIFDVEMRRVKHKSGR